MKNLADYLFNKGDKIVFDVLGPGAEACNNLTVNKEYEVVTPTYKHTQLFGIDAEILLPGMFEIKDDAGDLIVGVLGDGLWGYARPV